MPKQIKKASSKSPSKVLKKQKTSQKITKPTLVVDCSKVRSNIKRMVARAKKNKVFLRPHFKTHQSKVIGKMYQKEFGLRAITVSSVSMAEYFVNECKYKDIMIAVPVNVLEIDRIDVLAKKIRVGVFVDSLETLEYLKKLKNQIHIWVEIDIEYHRTGLDFSKVKPIQELAKAIVNEKKAKFVLEGIYVHSGNSYNGRSKKSAQATFDKSVKEMK